MQVKKWTHRGRAVRVQDRLSMQDAGEWKEEQKCEIKAQNNRQREESIQHFQDRCHSKWRTALTDCVTLLRASTRSLLVCWTRPVKSWDSTVASQPLHNILRAASASPVSFQVVWQRCRSGTSESRGARILFTACGAVLRKGGKGENKGEVSWDTAPLRDGWMGPNALC